MSSHLSHTAFQELIFPPEVAKDLSDQSLNLRRLKQVRVAPQQDFSEMDFCVFDFETTGLDTKRDRVIEIGALRVSPDGTVKEYSTLIDPQVKISQRISEICGLTQSDLNGQPTVDKVWDEFLDFMSGGLLVAHNAEFDYAFLKHVSARFDLDLSMPCFCTLKMARAMLPQLPNRTLDTLAEHFDLQFESRHRSIGDCKVTLSVLQGMLELPGQNLKTWKDLEPFSCK